MIKITFITYIIITSLALITIKLSSASGAPISFSNGNILLDVNIYTIIGVSLYGLSFLIYTYLISKFSLGFIVPITTALVYAVVFMASFFIFHEVFTMIKIAAISLIIVGGILLNFNK